MAEKPVFIVQSTEDPASQNILRELREVVDLEPVEPPGKGSGLPPLGTKVRLQEGWESAHLPAGRDILVFTVEGLHIHAEGLGEHLTALADREPEAIIVASRHRAASGKPSLTVHPVGNFSAADHGGQPGRLTPAHAPLQTALLRNLARRAAGMRRLEGYEVTFEATHHGPYTAVPLVYAEVGSGPEQWELAEGGRAVALAILDSLVRALPHGPIVAGVGGGHYAHRFTPLALERHASVGHMLPNYHWTDEEGLDRCLGVLGQSLPPGAGLYLDRKGLKGPEVKRVEAWAEAQGRRVYRSADLALSGRRNDRH